jgi:hypothetical protein
MSRLLNVYGDYGAAGDGLPSGQSQYWEATGGPADPYRVVWFSADELGGGGPTSPGRNTSLEVLHIAKTIDNQGNRVTTFEVHNNGSPEDAFYVVCWAVTDVIA